MTAHKVEFNDVLPDAAAEIVFAGRKLSAHGWVPATSGNISRRLDEAHMAVTASGIDKGELENRHVLVSGIHEAPAPGVSAEAGLHQAIYRYFPDAQAIVHTHSINSTIISRRRAGQGEIVFKDYEILKAFAGIRTHETTLHVAILPNSQDIADLAQKLERRLPEFPEAPGFMIAGHGLYAWGRSMTDALRHAEAFEFLLACSLVPEDDNL